MGHRTSTRPRTWRLLLVVVLLAVSYLAVTPAPPRQANLGWDKLNHFAAFFVIGVLACRAYPGNLNRMATILLALLTYGAAIEIIQIYVPGRSAEWFDLLADGVGSLCGALLAWATRQPDPRADLNSASQP